MRYHVEFDIDLKKNPYKGLYIALEGIDGSGKTTQIEELVRHFKKKGKEVIETYEPRRDGAMGKLVKNILLEKERVPEVALQYLFAAQRAVHQEEIIVPALKKGAIVVSDRCFWSSIPYGLLDRFEAGRDENSDQLLASLSVLSMYHQFIAPDASFLLDVPIKTAGERLIKKSGKAEHYEKKEKLAKIREGYSFLLSRFPQALKRIEGDRPVKLVTEEILYKINSIKK